MAPGPERGAHRPDVLGAGAAAAADHLRAHLLPLAREVRVALRRVLLALDHEELLAGLAEVRVLLVAQLRVGPDRPREGLAQLRKRRRDGGREGAHQEDAVHPVAFERARELLEGLAVEHGPVVLDVADAQEHRQARVGAGVHGRYAVRERALVQGVAAEVLGQQAVDARVGEHARRVAELVAQVAREGRGEAARQVGLGVDPVAHLARELHGAASVILPAVLLADLRELGARGVEGVRDQDLGAGLQVVLVDLADDIRGLEIGRGGPDAHARDRAIVDAGHLGGRVPGRRGGPLLDGGAPADVHAAAVELAAGAPVHQDHVARTESIDNVSCRHGAIIPARPAGAGDRRSGPPRLNRMEPRWPT
jgi:hypothetical protein